MPKIVLQNDTIIQGLKNYHKKEIKEKINLKKSVNKNKDKLYRKINYLNLNPKIKSKSKKKYNDRNVDYDLHHEVPEKINSFKIKLSNTCTYVCKMTEANGELKGLTYNMAVIALYMKLKNGNASEFILPLSLAPNLKKALEISINANKEFFDKSTSKKLSL